MKNPLSVLVTGAGSGIGEATARYFSEKGHQVVLTARNKESLERVSKSLPNKSWVIKADLKSADDIKRLARETLKVLPELSVVINNAGIYEVKGFTDSSDEFWQNILDINLMAPIRLTRELIPTLKKSQGVVVNVGSTAGYRPRPSGSAYTTSKAALISLSQSLAREFAPDRVRFHCVCPGIVETPIHKLDSLSKEAKEAQLKKWSQYAPLGRAGRPEEIAQAIYNLCTPEAQWMTGVVLPVDGGISLE